MAENIKLKIEIKVEEVHCSLAIFRINGQEAKKEDFVDLYDHLPSPEEDYDFGDEDEFGCDDMRADVLLSQPKILLKYDITQVEYEAIANILVEKLFFGKCDFCR